MKKSIALLGLLSIVTAGAIIRVHSAPIVIYRSFFNPSQSSCWDGGVQYFAGGGHQTITNNSSLVYQVNPGDQLNIYIKSKCCGTGDPQHGILVGDQWEQYSTDGGVTWNVVIGSGRPTYVPQDVMGEAYSCGNNANGITQAYTIEPCP